MFQYRLIGRLRDGSEYWAEEDWRQAYAEYIEETGISGEDCGENRVERNE